MIRGQAKPPAADPGVPNLNAVALPILERYGGKRGRQALALIAAAQLMAPAAKWAWTKARTREDFTITVAGGDDIYSDLHEWVLARMPEQDRKALIASTTDSDRGNGAECADVGEDERGAAQVRLRYDGSRRQKVAIDGHKVQVYVEREDVAERQWRATREKITFVASTAAARDAVVDMIRGLLEAKQAAPRPPALFMPSRWGGGWDRRGDLPPRTLDSVVLKAGQLERLVDDMSAFLASEDWYAQMSQPWHRGYLFHGTPGTGKTSIARALANHFGMPTYYLPLGDIDRDTDLMTFVGQIKPRSVLLIEDVDNFHAATEREEKSGKATVAGMLNALDGVWTPHGLITVMTTNCRDKLDEALIRKGRIDFDEEFSPLDREQATRLAARFAEPDLAVGAFVGGSPAAMIGELRRLKMEATA